MELWKNQAELGEQLQPETKSNEPEVIPERTSPFDGKGMRVKFPFAAGPTQIAVLQRRKKPQEPTTETKSVSQERESVMKDLPELQKELVRQLPEFKELSKMNEPPKQEKELEIVRDLEKKESQEFFSIPRRDPLQQAFHDGQLKTWKQIHQDILNKCGVSRSKQEQEPPGKRLEEKEFPEQSLPKGRELTEEQKLPIEEILEKALPEQKLPERELLEGPAIHEELPHRRVKSQWREEEDLGWIFGNKGDWEAEEGSGLNPVDVKKIELDIEPLAEIWMYENARYYHRSKKVLEVQEQYEEKEKPTRHEALELDVEPSSSLQKNRIVDENQFNLLLPFRIGV